MLEEEDFYSGSKKDAPPEDEYDFELSVSNERSLEKDGKRVIKVCTGVPSQRKFGKTFSVFDKKPQARKPRSSISKSESTNEKDDGENGEEESVISTQKSASCDALCGASEMTREPTEVICEEASPPKKKRKSLEGDKKPSRTPSGKTSGNLKRKSSRSPQSSAASSLANLSWDNESEDDATESTSIINVSEIANRSSSSEVAKPVNPSTYTEIIELAGLSQTVDDLTYAFDGFENPAVKNDCCVQILDLCCQNSESIGLVFRSKNFFARLFDAVGLADNSVFEFALVSVFFVLLSGDNQTNNNSFYFNDDRALQLMVRALSRQDALAGSLSSTASSSSDSIQSTTKKRRRGSLLAAIRSNSAKNNSQNKSGPIEDPNVTEIKKLLSQFSVFEGIPPEKMTPECVSIECLSILSASFVNRRVKNEFTRLGVNGAVESALLRCAGSDWTSNPCSVKLLESSMAFVENAAYMNKENQDCFTRSGKLIPALVSVLKAAVESDDVQRTEKTVPVAMKALINLVEKGESASKQCASAGVLDVLAKELKTFVAKSMFDHSVLTVALLINLTEASKENRITLGQGCGFIPTLVSVFRKADLFVEGNEGQVFSAYCAVLLGCLAKDVPENAEAMIQSGICFDELSARVTEFVTFQSDAGILSAQAQESYLEVIEVFQKLDQLYRPNPKLN